MNAHHEPTLLNAVDELASVRAQMMALKTRETELCNEIRACASQDGTTHVLGEKRVAVIETRFPTSLDISALPPEIANNPEYLIKDTVATVILWPNATPETSNASDAPSLSVPAAPRPLDDAPASDPQCDDAAPAEGAGETTTQLTSSNEQAAPEIAEPQIEPEQQLVTEAPTMGMPDEVDDFDFGAVDIGADFSEEISETSSIPNAETGKIDALDDFDAGFDVDKKSGTNSTLTLIEPSFTQENDVGGDADAQVDAEIDDWLANEPILVADPEDLRPTAHTELQPFGGLVDDDVAMAVTESEMPLASATMPDALTETRRIEAQIDTRISEEEQNSFASFTTARAATGTDG